MGDLNKLKLFFSKVNERPYSRGQQSSEVILILAGVLMVGIIIGVIMLNLGAGAGSGTSSTIAQIIDGINSLGGSSSIVIPAAPLNLTATAASSTRLNLSWTDNSNNETGFKIERATSSTGTWTQIATTATNVATYNNTGLTANTTYYYRVRANNSSGNSAYSNTANATTNNFCSGNYKLGDLDEDGFINALDTQLWSNLNSGTVTIQQYPCGDVEPDNDYDAVDAQTLSNCQSSGACTNWPA